MPERQRTGEATITRSRVGGREHKDKPRPQSTIMKRYRYAIFLNVLIPGSGLIVLRREWLGLSISVLFSLFAQIVIFGWLIVPLDIPKWAVTASVAGLAAVWGLSQYLVFARIRQVSSPELARELHILRTRAREMMDRGEYAEARQVLLLARSVDDEDAESAVLWAKLTEQRELTR